MLRSANDLKDFSIDATDGEIGRVEEFYFDDDKWTVRYIIVNTGGWFSAKKVLISPAHADTVDSLRRSISTGLTRQEVKDSPPVDAEKPISRQHESDYNDHHKFPHYWAGPKLWGPAAAPREMRQNGEAGSATASRSELRRSNCRLRNTKEVAGYAITCNDGEVGHVDDFLIDDYTWTIRYLVVDTRNWWPGKKVMISPLWITCVGWHERKVRVDRSRWEIKNSPEYDDSSDVDREYEERLHRHYRQPGYWDS